MRRGLLGVCLGLVACDPFGLGSPAGLAPADGGDTGASDANPSDTGPSDTGASDAGPDAAVVTTPLLFYRADTGEVALFELGDTGRLDARRGATLAPGLTHLVALGGDRLVTYDATSGARAVLSVDAAAARFVTLSSDSAPGFTALGSLGGGRLLSYRATTGTLRIDALVGTAMGKVAEYTGGEELVGHDELAVTRAGPFLLYTRSAWRAWIGGWSAGASVPTGVAHADISQGWSHITAVAKTHLFFYVSEGPDIGNAAFTQIDATGADLDFLLWNADRPLPIGRDAWSHVVGGPRAMLFYRREDGAVRTAAIATDEDLRFVFLELTPAPPPVVGKGWTHVTSLR